MSTNVLFRPTFADLRAELERRSAQNASADELVEIVEQFLATGGEAPLPWVEYDGTTTWLYRDATAGEVALVGDIVGYDTQKNRLTRLPGTDLFFLTAHIPLDAQLAYVFAVDNPTPADGEYAARQTWLQRCLLDPFNPNQIVEIAPLRAFSTLAMPNARTTSELDGAASLGGSVAFHVVGSAQLGNWRRVWVYLPPDYDPVSRRYPTLYFYGGESYLISARAPEIIDALLTQGEVVPAILVFVESLGHCDEWTEHDTRLIDFLADELTHWIDERYATSTDPQERAIGGAGQGAALSLMVALERPDVFGRVVAQSPAGSAYLDRLPELLERNAARGYAPPACYVDGGRYQNTEEIQYIQALCDSLLTSKAALSYQGFAGDAGFLSWRTTLPDALRFH
ncbi:MAG TPA: alpha/beta hydrolase-fold protein, partial [Roseiflexaceae bacterium]|nr:alpha/beta hydrolase-fold protein [Roseiflexaceae bacterium]